MGRAKAIAADAKMCEGNLTGEYAEAWRIAGLDAVTGSVSVSSGIFAVKPGDGSAREQAASCQRVLGGSCNIAREYATKRYRSNLINWGMLPFVSDDDFLSGDIVIVVGVKDAVASGESILPAKLVRDGKASDITLKLDKLTDEEKRIILSGCLINYYRDGE